MRLDKNKLLLYGVTDKRWTGKKSLAQQTEDAIKGDVTFIQYREKNLKFDEFCKEAESVQRICKKYNVPFVINDNIKAAIKLDADGVHIGQDDMDIINARQILGNDKIIGVSVKNAKQAEKAEKSGADYLGVGAVFKTMSKQDAESVSIDTLKDICKSVKIPVVAIGGICIGNVIKLKNSGIQGAAIISAIFGAENITESAACLKNAMENIVGFTDFKERDEK